MADFARARLSRTTALLLCWTKSARVVSSTCLRVFLLRDNIGQRLWLRTLRRQLGQIATPSGTLQAVPEALSDCTMARLAAGFSSHARRAAMNAPPMMDAGRPALRSSASCVWSARVLVCAASHAATTFATAILSAPNHSSPTSSCNQARGAVEVFNACESCAVYDNHCSQCCLDVASDPVFIEHCAQVGFQLADCCGLLLLRHDRDWHREL